jgi:hypothetical protein
VSQLINEILLRFVKPLLAAVIGLITYAVAVALLHANPSFELAAVCWVSGAVLILLMETSPL